MRWSVVPPSFRSQLPDEHKSRDSHDIVLLCTRARMCMQMNVHMCTYAHVLVDLLHMGM